MKKLMKAAALTLVLVGVAACEDEADPTSLVGVMLDMTVDGKPAGGFPTMEVTTSRTGGSPTQITAELRFLDPLQGAGYQLFLVSLDGTRIVPAEGTYETIQYDTVRVSRDSIEVTITTTDHGLASGTSGGARNVTHRFTIPEASLSPDSLDHFGHIVVALQPGSATLDASAPAPLFFKYRDESREPNTNAAWISGNSSIGRFVAGGETYVFIPNGTGLGAFYTEDREGEPSSGGDRLQVNLSHLARPPLGYEYHAWLVGPSGDKDLGPLLSPYPDLVSLADADRASPTAGSVVQAREIVEATIRTDEPTLGARFHDYNQFLITLENKAGASGRGPWVAMGADIPASILSRRQAQ